MSATEVAVPGTVVPSGSLTSPAGGQGIQGLQGVAGESYPIGVIVPYTSTTAPPTWMICDGSAISRATYPALFAVCGTTFGAGDGSTTFNLPDLRGRVGVGAGQGASLSNRLLAAIGGEETHLLSIAEMPAHTHQQWNFTGTGQAGANSNAVSGNTQTGSAGGGTAHNTMPPFVVVAYIIKVSSGGGATAQAPIADTTQDGLLRKVSGLSTDYVGGDNACHPITQVNGFISKTSAYTLTSADSNKYIICSGGSWTLTLPTAVVGLTYNVRNDMGISGTTGTITIARAGAATIDGQTSIALLPQQECTLITDGTNWRTLGLKREVILGTLDITSATGVVNVLLPAGFRVFVLDFGALTTSVDADLLQMTLSTDGGNTFLTSYYWSMLYNSSATAAAANGGNADTTVRVGMASNSGGASTQLKIFPGTPNQRASYLSTTEYFFVGGNFVQLLTIGGFATSPLLVNAARFVPSSGTINNMLLTVRGIV
jgi:microcystin-dependent protein